jgi:hypothetical protein
MGMAQRPEFERPDDVTSPVPVDVGNRAQAEDEVRRVLLRLLPDAPGGLRSPGEREWTPPSRMTRALYGIGLKLRDNAPI